MKKFGFGERIRTIIFWILAIIGIGVAVYFLMRQPTVWPQSGTIAAVGEPYATGEMIDTFNNIPEIAYPVRIQPSQGEAFDATVPKEDYESISPGQQVKWKKLPMKEIPSHDLRL
jgi:hypothetical protein